MIQVSSSPSVPAGGGSRPAAPSGGNAPEAPGDDVLEDLTPEQLAAQWEEEKPPAAGALANAASSLVVLGVGTGALVLSVAMGLGTPAAPEPGLWPFMISCVMNGHSPGSGAAGVPRPVATDRTRARVPTPRKAEEDAAVAWAPAAGGSSSSHCAARA